MYGQLIKDLVLVLTTKIFFLSLGVKQKFVKTALLWSMSKPVLDHVLTIRSMSSKRWRACVVFLRLLASWSGFKLMILEINCVKHAQADKGDPGIPHPFALVGLISIVLLVSFCFSVIWCSQWAVVCSKTLSKVAPAQSKHWVPECWRMTPN